MASEPEIEINISQYLSEFDSDPNPTFATYHDKLHQLARRLCDEIKRALLQKEQLNFVEDTMTHHRLYPLLEDNSPEIYFWAISIITSAWAKWIFTAKTNNPQYQNDPAFANDQCRQAAAVNARLSLPYVKNSIDDALTRACEIGSNAGTHYRPQEFTVKIQLRKLAN